MTRLTQKDEQGNWCLRGVSWDELNSGKISVKSREILYGALCKLKDYKDTGLNPDGVNNLMDLREWVPCSDPPKTDEYVLLSFENFGLPLVGRYSKDEAGGSYYIGDCDGDDTCISNNLFVNAWMPLPGQYLGKGGVNNDNH